MPMPARCTPSPNFLPALAQGAAVPRSRSPAPLSPTAFASAAAVADACGYGAGVAYGVLRLSTRLAHPGFVGIVPFMMRPASAWLWRHLARAPEAPVPNGFIAPLWAFASQACWGLAWGLVFAASAGTPEVVWLAVACASIAVGVVLNALTGDTKVGVWARLGACVHFGAALVCALGVQLQTRLARRQAPGHADHRLAHEVHLAHAQARAQTAWTALMHQERDVWRHVGVAWPPGPQSLAWLLRGVWGAGCVIGCPMLGAACHAPWALGVGAALGTWLPQSSASPKRRMQDALMLAFGLAAYAG